MFESTLLSYSVAVFSFLCVLHSLVFPDLRCSKTGSQQNNLQATKVIFFFYHLGYNLCICQPQFPLISSSRFIPFLVSVFSYSTTVLVPFVFCFFYSLWIYFYLFIYQSLPISCISAPCPSSHTTALQASQEIIGFD